MLPYCAECKIGFLPFAPLHPWLKLLMLPKAHKMSAAHKTRKTRTRHTRQRGRKMALGDPFMGDVYTYFYGPQARLSLDIDLELCPVLDLCGSASAADAAYAADEQLQSKACELAMEMGAPMMEELGHG
jgi:hypothetical protein